MALSRNPMMNDLIMQPSETGVLHDSSQFGGPFKFGKPSVSFSFEWMLSIPAYMGKVPSVEVTDKPSIIATNQIPYHNYKPLNWEYVNVYWNSVPFCWANYTRRNAQYSIIAVKPPTPYKLQVDFNYSDIITLDTSDVYSKRNLVRELDLTLQRRHVIEVSGVYATAYKAASLQMPVIYTSGGKTTNFDYYDDFIRDGTITLTQILPNQRGMIYPDQFYIHRFISYASSVITCIACPSACTVDFTDSRVLSRYLPGSDNPPSDISFRKNFPSS